MTVTYCDACGRKSEILTEVMIGSIGPYDFCQPCIEKLRTIVNGREWQPAGVPA